MQPQAYQARNIFLSILFAKARSRLNSLRVFIPAFSKTKRFIITFFSLDHNLTITPLPQAKKVLFKVLLVAETCHTASSGSHLFYFPNSQTNTEIFGGSVLLQKMIKQLLRREVIFFWSIETQRFKLWQKLLIINIGKEHNLAFYTGLWKTRGKLHFKFLHLKFLQHPKIEIDYKKPKFWKAHTWKEITLFIHNLLFVIESTRLHANNKSIYIYIYIYI